MQTAVYFRKFSINQNTNSATLIVSDVPMVQSETTIAGLKVASRKQTNISFGVLSLMDPETGQVMKADHPTIKQLQSKLNRGDKMPGFRLSDNTVMNLSTGEETDLRWVEAV